MVRYEYLYFWNSRKEHKKIAREILNVKYEAIENLIKKFSNLPHTAEYSINEYLWGEAGDILEKELMRRMPRSKDKHYGLPKAHAKDTDSLEIFKGINLMVKVETKIKPKSKDYGYLIFPDEGRGIHNIRKGAQEFFQKTLDAKEYEITDRLTKHLIEDIDKNINN